MNLLFAADYPGGARFLSAVAPPARARGYDVTFLGQGATRRIWEGTGETVITDYDQAPAPNLIVTGTGGGDYELSLWHRSKSLAVIDAWANFPIRFETASGEICLPNAIGVIDADCQSEIQAFPWCTVPVFITGQPHLERLIPQVIAARQRRRGRSGKVVFFSDPFDSDIGREVHGYDQFEIGTAVAEALRGVELLIKPHPREDPDVWRAKMLPYRVKIMTGDGSEILTKADGVLGMTSMVLLEARFAGIPALSVQIGRRYLFNPVIDKHVPVVTKHEDLGLALEAFVRRIEGAEPEYGEAMFGGSAFKCLTAIGSMIQA